MTVGKETAWSVVDMTDGSVFDARYLHISEERAGEIAAEICTQTNTDRYFAVPHYISPASCPKCADIAAGHARMNRTRR